MRNDLIAKTLLSIWPGLQDYEQMLASRAQTHALCSFNSPLLTERIMDKIIDLNVKQRTLHNIKLSLEQVIAHLPLDVQKVVRSHYHSFEATENVAVMAQKLNLSERSYFRKLNSAINYLAQKLPQLGINFFTWQYLLNNYRWIKETFTRELQPHRRRKPWRNNE